MERDQGVHHRTHGHKRKQARGYAANRVAEVEQPDGEAAEQDREVEIGEERTLVGKEDFGLDARGEGNALAWRRGV